MAIIRQSLTETANTFSQNQTLNGTANTAPNQTAASASSLMSRTLVDDEPFFNIARCFNPLPVPSTGTAGGGTASVNTNGYYVNLGMPYVTSASTYARASLCRLSNNDYGTSLNFNQRRGVMIKGMFKNDGDIQMGEHTTMSRVIVGGNGAVPAVGTANALTTQGFGFEMYGSNYDTSSRAVFYRAFCHNGTTYTTGSYVNVGTSAVEGTVGVISNGAGSVSLYFATGTARPTIIQTITGGPTGSSTNDWLDVVMTAAASSVGYGFISIQDAKIITG
jgi:hypothetical protein